ncbi:histone-lysine N-methyltransferase PRDM9 isoform X2 [Ctenopharyngodon idella]|uniref:histone-lysine N-methyltransferase PRDM9 isoform X2 n=1 Tax=Ctenopharyngodon idella TaxID=7959 RepID=UPI00222EB975|nr:histone-lysine N-methyltransferase PRDM9 isoform X2 [Ctenopharyngodon idella]
MSDSSDLPPSDEHTLEIQGSVTNCAVVMIEEQEDSMFNDQHFYCEMCHQHFIDQCEVHGPPLFTCDSPAAIGIPQRALLTLPQGLVIGRSSISNAGLGVFNQGQTVPLGMHFGPFDGEVTCEEKALDSAYSWVIYRGNNQYSYIDAERDTHSNWMKFVVCSRNETEQNLVAFQQNGRILFRCCRPISPGQEFRVWYAEEYAQGLGTIWDKIWNKKCISLGTTEELATQDCPCPHCHYSFPTIFYLRVHVKRSHPDQYAHFMQTQPLESEDHSTVIDVDQCLLDSDAAPPTHTQPMTESCQSQISNLNGQPMNHSKKSDCTDLSETCSNGLSDQANCAAEISDEINKCDECGRNFLRSCHLKRHQRTIHSKEKPYCCSRCRKCFSQATGLKRHQQTHQGEEKKDKDADRSSDIYPCTKCSFSFVAKFNLYQHLKRHHHGEYLKLVESGSLTAGTEGDTEMNSDKHDPTYEPPTRLRRSPKNPLRGRSRPKKVPVGRSRGRPPKNKQAAEVEVQKSLPICTECEQSFSDLETLKTHQCAGQDNNKMEEPQETPASQHVCGECLRAFSNFDLLKAHECIQQGDGSYCCSHCNLYFNRMCNLRRHERTIHSKEKPYCCTVCLKSFTQSSGLKRHQQSHSRRKTHRQSSALVNANIFPCTYCPFSFTDERYLYKHIRRHHPEMSVKYLSFQEGGVLSVEKPHSCSQCCKSFSTIKGFKNHSCFKQGEKVYLCTDCGKAFSWFNSLKQHQRIHTGEKPYTCQQCGKSFVHSGQLNVHLRTHTGEKPFLCSQCGESFRQSGDLRRHEQKHSGVRPCQCPDCGKSFSRPQSLKAHQQLHNGTKLFPCTQCGKSFTRRYHLTRHHQKMHS